jgi:hypothetical protein
MSPPCLRVEPVIRHEDGLRNPNTIHAGLVSSVCLQSTVGPENCIQRKQLSCPISNADICPLIRFVGHTAQHMIIPDWEPVKERETGP